jgi:hypothetical protein
MERVRVDLEPAEFKGLVRLSERELRPVPAQIRHLVREALNELGLLPDVPRYARDGVSARPGRDMP